MGLTFGNGQGRSLDVACFSKGDEASQDGGEPLAADVASALSLWGSWKSGGTLETRSVLLHRLPNKFSLQLERDWLELKLLFTKELWGERLAERTSVSPQSLVQGDTESYNRAV